MNLNVKNETEKNKKVWYFLIKQDLHMYIQEYKSWGLINLHYQLE